MAAREGDADAADFLLGAGSDPTLLNGQNQTALEVACVWAEDELELQHALRAAVQSKTQQQRLRSKVAVETALAESSASVDAELGQQAEPVPPTDAVDSLALGSCSLGGGMLAACASSMAAELSKPSCESMLSQLTANAETTAEPPRSTRRTASCGCAPETTPAQVFSM